MVVDNSGSLVSLYQLLTALDPSVLSIQVRKGGTVAAISNEWMQSVINIPDLYISGIFLFFFQALFTAILKPKQLSSVTYLVRWLGFVCTLLELMASLFNEQAVFDAIRWILDFNEEP